MSPEDKTLLLDAAAKACASDPDPEVRALAGWTLGVSLRSIDIQSLPDYQRLGQLLASCALNEPDPRAKKILAEVSSLPPFKTEQDRYRNRVRFNWPQERRINERREKKEAPSPPKPESANEF